MCLHCQFTTDPLFLTTASCIPIRKITAISPNCMLYTTIQKTCSFFYLKHMPDAHLLRANSIFDLKQAPADAGNVFQITKNCVSVVM